MEKYKKDHPRPKLRNVRMISNETDTRQPETLKGRLGANLIDTVTFLVSRDDGADHPALCDSHLEFLASASTFVSTLPLETLVTMEEAASSGTQLQITAHRKARI